MATAAGAGDKGIRSGPFATKPIEALVGDTQKEGQSLKREVGLLDLSALELGAIIGTARRSTPLSSTAGRCA